MSDKRYISTLLVTAATILIQVVARPAVVHAQCQANELAKLTASDTPTNAWFGKSVSVSGDVAVIGACHLDGAGTDSGAAYVYHFDGTNWTEQAALTATDAAAGDRFGGAVFIAGNVALIGACWDDDGGTNSGSVYVYRFDGANWIEEAELTPASPIADARFGKSVCMSGDVAVIGAPRESHLGAVYVFRFDGNAWIEEVRLSAHDPEQHDRFGWSVGISGDVILIGAWGDDDRGSESGSAYVFRNTGGTWVEETKLIASDGAPQHEFGYSVAINGDVAVSGAHLHDGAGSGSGSAYVYRWIGDNWIEEARLTAADTTTGDEFGFSVAIDGDRIVVGAVGDDDAGSASGSAYVFGHDGSAWAERAKLAASDGAASESFGYSVSINGDVALSGTPYDDVGNDSGSAYAFHGLSDCNGNDVLDICDIVDGTSQDHNGNGTPDECECPGDLDDDGDTDQADLGILLSDWGCDDPVNGCAGDLNGDDKTDQSDLGILLADWGCGTG